MHKYTKLTWGQYTVHVIKNKAVQLSNLNISLFNEKIAAQTVGIQTVMRQMLYQLSYQGS